MGGAHPPRSVTENCARCHGLDGLGRGNAAFPALAGQSERYLISALEVYANDRRQSGMMQPLAAALTPDDWREVAEYYSWLQPRAGDSGGDASAILGAGDRITVLSNDGGFNRAGQTSTLHARGVAQFGWVAGSRVWMGGRGSMLSVAAEP